MPRNGSGVYTAPINSWNPSINGVSATLTDWQALLNDIAAALTAATQSPGDNSLNTATTAFVQVAVTNATQSLTGKNLIMNGAMVIDQANAGAAVTVNNAFFFNSVDGWKGFGQVTDGVFTLQQMSGGPVGAQKYLRATVTTADASIGAGQIYALAQSIEDNNVVSLAFGTASASSIAISFAVNCSLTGTFSGSVRNAAANRSYPFTYTINTANTWEKKSIVVPGDVTGVWPNNTNPGTSIIGLDMIFDLGSGSTFKGTANTWAAANYIGVTGAVNLIATNGATFNISLAQLEQGNAATAFENEDIATTLGKCIRYLRYLKSITTRGYNTAGNGVVFAQAHVPPMRATPAVTYSGVSYTNASGIISLTNTQDVLTVQAVATVTGDAYYSFTAALDARL